MTDHDCYRQYYYYTSTMLIRMINCAIGQQLKYRIGQFALSSLWATIQIMSTPWAGSKFVSSVKVNCLPWGPVHFALGTSVFRNRISLGKHKNTRSLSSQSIHKNVSHKLPLNYFAYFY